MVVKIPHEWRGNSHRALSPTWALSQKELVVMMLVVFSPQCRELHLELDNLSDEYLSCLRKLQHCREELNQSPRPLPRVRGSILPYRPGWWWDRSSFSQILQIIHQPVPTLGQPIPFSLVYILEYNNCRETLAHATKPNFHGTLEPKGRGLLLAKVLNGVLLAYYELVARVRREEKKKE